MLKKTALLMACLVAGLAYSAEVRAATIMGQSQANVIEFFKTGMPGWEFNGKGFKSLEYKHKDKNFVIRVYLNPNVTGIRLDANYETRTVEVPQTKEGDKVFKKAFHIEDADVRAVLNQLIGGSAYKLSQRPEDEYFSKARESTGSIKTPGGAYNVTDFSVMSLPNETLRVRIKFSVGQTS